MPKKENEINGPNQGNEINDEMPGGLNRLGENRINEIDDLEEEEEEILEEAGSQNQNQINEPNEDNVPQENNQNQINEPNEVNVPQENNQNQINEPGEVNNINEYELPEEENIQNQENAPLGGYYDLNGSFIMDDDEVGPYNGEETTLTMREVANDYSERRQEPQNNAGAEQLDQQQDGQGQQQQAPVIPDTVYQRFEAPADAVQNAGHYNRLEQALLGISRTAGDFDQEYEILQYIAALHMLSHNLETYEAPYETTFGNVPVSFSSRDEAWKFIHEPGRLERIRNYKDDTQKTIEERLRETNKNTGVNLNNLYSTIAGETVNPFAPENQQQVFHQDAHAFDGLAEYLASYTDPEYEKTLQNLKLADVNERLAAIEERDISENGAPFNPERLQGNDKRDYAFYSDLKSYGEALKSENYDTDNRSLYDLRQIYGLTDFYRTTVIKHQADEGFVRGVRAMDRLIARNDKAVTGEELNGFVDSLLDRPEIKNATTPPGSIVKEVAAGDASKFEDLLDRNVAYADLLALQHLNKVIEQEVDHDKYELGDQKSLSKKINQISTEDLREVSLKHANDPLFRRGVVAFKDHFAIPTQRLTLRRLDSAMNAKMMADTLSPLSPQQIKNLDQGLNLKGDVEKLTDAVEQNINKQTSMAKVLFLSQLGTVAIRTEEGENLADDSYSDDIGNLFAHGQRVTINLPVTENANQLYDSIFGRNHGEGQGVYSVLTSGHRINGQSYTEDSVVDFFPNVAPTLDIYDNYAMDLPVGGLGTADAAGKIKIGSSEDGKAVIKMQNGNPGSNTGATLSFGIRKPSQKSHASTPFLSDIGGNLGDEFGGRDINLYRIKGESLTNLMNRFDQYYRKLQKDAMNDPEKAKELAEANKLLTGKSMNKDTIVPFMTTKLGVGVAEARQLFDVLHAPHETKMTKDMWVNIPAPEDPNANKSENQIKKEAQDARMRMEAGVRDRLFEGVSITEGKEEAENEEKAKENAPKVSANNKPLPTLENYLITNATKLMHTTNKSKQQTIIHSMLNAATLAGGDKYKTVDESKFDLNRVSKIPSVEYQMKYDYNSILHNAKTGNVRYLMSGSTDLINKLEAPDEGQAISHGLKKIYNQLNVPDLKKRSKEYQRLVKAVGKASLKENLSGEEKLAVINSVKNYADKKRVVPRTDNGKISLDLAYQALETVLPSNDNTNWLAAKRQFLNPLKDNITRLRDEMDARGLRGEELEPPMPGVNNNNLGL